MCVQFDDCQLLGVKYSIGDKYGALVVWYLYGENRRDICALSTINPIWTGLWSELRPPKWVAWNKQVVKMS